MKSTILVGDLNILLSEMDRPSRQKVTKDIAELNTTMNQLDVMDIYRLPHPRTAEYIFFSIAHGTFTERDHILSHKIHLNIFKRIEIIKYLWSDHNGIILEINNRRVIGTSPNTRRLNSTILNKTWVKELL